jgi:DNA-binding MarR family transcriptional regulator
MLWGVPADPAPASQRAAAALAVFKTSSWLLREVSPVFAEHGITATRFDALEALSRHGGTARPAELRDALHLPAQTITSVLDQLQAAGLVTRSPHPSDRRSTIAALTPAGPRAIDRICPPLIDIEQDCLSALSPAEQTQLTDLLTRVQEQITRRRNATTTNAQ